MDDSQGEPLYEHGQLVGYRKKVHNDLPPLGDNDSWCGPDEEEKELNTDFQKRKSMDVCKDVMGNYSEDDEITEITDITCIKEVKEVLVNSQVMVSAYIEKLEEENHKIKRLEIDSRLLDTLLEIAERKLSGRDMEEYYKYAEELTKEQE